MAKDKEQKLRNGAFEQEEVMDDTMMDDEAETDTDADMMSGGNKGTSMITAMADEAPELQGLQPGDTATISVQVTVESVNDDGSMELSVDSIVPTSAAAETDTGGAMGGGMPPAGAPAGGLSGLLG